MFGLSLPPVLFYWRAHLLFTLFVVFFCPTLYLVVFLFLFFFVLGTQYCQFRWIVHFWLPFWYSLTFIFCLPTIDQSVSHLNIIVNE